MSDLVPVARNAVAAAAGIVGEALRFTILVARLAAAGASLRHMGGLARSTFNYVEDCARSVDRLAETAAGMRVDRDTVSEHHQAAQVMRSALAQAAAMAQQADEMSTLFEEASAAHQADYGPVAAAVQAMPVPMADREFYANR
jgi:hypothetical protein